MATEWAVPWAPREGRGRGGLCWGEQGCTDPRDAAAENGCLCLSIYIFVCVYLHLSPAEAPKGGGGFPTPPGGEDNNLGVPAGIFTREATLGDFPFVPVRIGLFRNKNYQDPRPPTPLPSLRRWMNGGGALEAK